MEKLLGERLYNAIYKKIGSAELYELRLRTGKEIHVKTSEGEVFLDETVNEGMLAEIVTAATNNSVYAYENQISNGYVDYRNGIRIGITGAGVNTDGNFVSVKKYYSLWFFRYY